MKPLLVGLHNPLSHHPRDALLPFPSGSTGWRLWMMMRDVDPDCSRQLLVTGCDRKNLWRGEALPSGKTSNAAYQREGRRLLTSCKGRSNVILLGARVWDSVAACTPPEWMECLEVLPGCAFWRVPMPFSGNHVYDSLERREQVGQLLLDLLQ